MTTNIEADQGNVRVKRHDYLFLPVIKILPSWVTPNHLSGLRLILCFPIIILMFLNFFKIVGAFFLFAALLDGLDGSMARLRNQETKLGAILDPTADKVVNFMVFLGFLFYIKSNVYLTMVLLILMIDSILFGTALFKFFFKDIVPKLEQDHDIFDHALTEGITVSKTGANAFGKTKMVLQVIVISFLLLFDPNTSLKVQECLYFLPKITLLEISYPLLLACIIFGILSLWGHLKVIQFNKK